CSPHARISQLGTSLTLSIWEARNSVVVGCRVLCASGRELRTRGGESEALRPLIVAQDADKLGSSCMQHPAAQQVELRSAVHFALEQLEPCNLPLDLPLAPR